MKSSLRKEPSPLKRSLQDPSAHSIPAAPTATRIKGVSPAGVATTRRREGRSMQTTAAISHKAARILVADVDQGSDAASNTASQSAIRWS